MGSPSICGSPMRHPGADYPWCWFTGWWFPAGMVPAAERLGVHHPVYAPDLPGFGKSAKPRQALDLAGLSDALASWMRAVGLNRAAFLGNSMGCQIVAEFALRHPSLIERAVLQGPTVDREARNLVRQAARLPADARKDSDFIGLDPDAFPRDFAIFVRYYTHLQERITARYPMPGPLGLSQLGRFLQEAGDRYRVRWIREAAAEQRVRMTV
jgi:pimeloyl-ACP methyl ester carboxylesterase